MTAESISGMPNHYSESISSFYSQKASWFSKTTNERLAEIYVVDLKNLDSNLRKRDAIFYWTQKDEDGGWWGMPQQEMTRRSKLKRFHRRDARWDKSRTLLCCEYVKQLIEFQKLFLEERTPEQIKKAKDAFENLEYHIGYLEYSRVRGSLRRYVRSTRKEAKILNDRYSKASPRMWSRIFLSIKSFINVVREAVSNQKPESVESNKPLPHELTSNFYVKCQVAVERAEKIVQPSGNDYSTCLLSLDQVNKELLSFRDDYFKKCEASDKTTLDSYCNAAKVKLDAMKAPHFLVKCRIAVEQAEEIVKNPAIDSATCLRLLGQINKELLCFCDKSSSETLRSYYASAKVELDKREEKVDSLKFFKKKILILSVEWEMKLFKAQDEKINEVFDEVIKEFKKQFNDYRLRYHPDKNINNQSENKEIFTSYTEIFERISNALEPIAFQKAHAELQRVQILLKQELQNGPFEDDRSIERSNLARLRCNKMTEAMKLRYPSLRSRMQHMKEYEYVSPRTKEGKAVIPYCGDFWKVVAKKTDPNFPQNNANDNGGLRHLRTSCSGV